MEKLIALAEAELKSFYLPYFKNENELQTFLDTVYEMDFDDRIPRQMIYQIQRFVTLSQRIEEIYPPRTGLRLLFLRIAMESLCTLDKRTTKNNPLFYSLFVDCFSEAANNYILGNFELTACYYASNDMAIGHSDLTMSDILTIIKFIRNQVVHDGVFWDFQMFNDNIEIPLFTHIEAQKLKLECVNYTENANIPIVYHFETTLQFDVFIRYFTEACIQYVNDYIDHLKNR
ncbi:hypothetical protein [Pseudobutyrivibrio ruminis]|uniref:Uncharacterized protein n=1 Tax=Pseudobutyrivibrio ruminis DSM 9787 TaxID=1123011 RepID=A0A285T4L5_9FIRM|nr:hypothetical protein [Pseudobutyrivibrio ruminis]SOC16301.1 hypothetical protein SAMN02910411_0361 [Pseudobutyrivibrio ruminis DSM 9787]